MKKSKITKLLVLALVAVVALGAVMAMAEDATEGPMVKFVKGEDKCEFVFDEKLSAYNDAHGHKFPDLFGDAMKGLMPGDSVKKVITVGAEGLDGNDFVEIGLTVDEQHLTLKDDQDQIIGDNISDEELSNFKNIVNVTVRSKDDKGEWQIINISNPAGESTALGKLSREKSTLEVEVEVAVPITLVNEYANKIGAIGWVFTAMLDEGSTGGGPTPPPPMEFIPEHYAYVIGRDDGLVHPEAEITRAEVATIFFRMFTDETRGHYWKQTNPFGDVFSADWFNNAVSTMYNAGVVEGYPDGDYKPNGSITRAEYAAMISRFFDTKYNGEDLFSDIDGHWAADLINNAAQNGLIEGYPDGTYRPDNYITRAEAMTGINRILGRAPAKDGLLKDMITWPDNMDTEKWYYADVQEATNSHDFEMGANKTEIWTKLLEVRDWAALETEWSQANSGKNPGEVVSSK